MGQYGKQASYNTIGNIVTLGCQWLIIMLIPRIGDFNEAGVFAIAISICSILNFVATFSLNQYQVADGYHMFSENSYRVVRLITILLSFVLVLPFILLFGYSEKQIAAVLLYLVYRNLLHFAYLYTASLQLVERLDAVGIYTAAEGVVSFLSFIIPYYVTGDLVLSTLLMAVLGGTSFCLMVIWGYRRYCGGPIGLRFKDKDEVVKLTLVGIPIFLGIVAPTIITAVPKLLLQSMDGDEIAGIFSTLSTPTMLFPTIITSVFAPLIVHYSKLAQSGDLVSIRRDFTRFTLKVAAFGVFTLVISLLFAGFAFGLLYGDEVQDYMGYFHVLVVGIFPYCVGMCGLTVLITKDQGRLAAISSFAALFINAALLWIAIHLYDIAGASYGLTASYFIFGLIVSLCAVYAPTNAEHTTENY